MLPAMVAWPLRLGRAVRQPIEGLSSLDWFGQLPVRARLGNVVRRTVGQCASPRTRSPTAGEAPVLKPNSQSASLLLRPWKRATSLWHVVACFRAGLVSAGSKCRTTVLISDSISERSRAKVPKQGLEP